MYCISAPHAKYWLVYTMRAISIFTIQVGTFGDLTDTHTHTHSALDMTDMNTHTLKPLELNKAFLSLFSITVDDSSYVCVPRSPPRVPVSL